MVFPDRVADIAKQLTPVDFCPCSRTDFRAEQKLLHLLYRVIISIDLRDIIRQRSLCPLRICFTAHIGECDKISLIMFCQLQCRADKARSKHVIAVNKSDKIAFCRFDSGVPCRRQPSVFLMDGLHTAVFCCIPVTQCATVIRRAIVYQNDFHIADVLCQNGSHTVSQIFRHIINRDNNANHIYPSPLCPERQICILCR